MGIEAITETLSRVSEEGKELLVKAHKSGHLYSALVGAGMFALISLGIRGCSSPSNEALKNLAPRVEVSEPTKFDFLNEKLYLRNYLAGKSIAMDSKKTPEGIVYFQGKEGGDVLLPARLDANGRVNYVNK